MPKALRMFVPLGLFLATFLAFSSAQAALFVNAQTGGCLDDRGAVTTDRNPLWAFPCNATFAQQWNWEGLAIQGIGTSAAGGKCVDVNGAGTADFTVVQLFTCNGTRAQTWRYLNGQVINTNSRKCLDANGGQPNQLVIRTCNGSLSQRWLIRS